MNPRPAGMEIPAGLFLFPRGKTVRGEERSRHVSEKEHLCEVKNKNRKS
jgi:hypothetical protein